MLNTEYDREFTFDIDAYLIEWYPSMDMKTRRTICSRAFDYLDTEELEAVVDSVVGMYAQEKLNIIKKEVEEVDD